MRILILVPHLSTGGQPAVALKRVEALLKNNNDVYLIEYRQIAWSFVVQRNKIEALLGDRFISLGNVWGDDESKRDNFENIINEINPDIIHMEEIPEKFTFGIRKDHTDWLYRPERTYKIIETTHTSTFDVNQKIYFPDKFMFVSPYSLKEYSKFNTISSLVEYPCEKLEKNKGLAISKLGLDYDYFHILNVGLFTSDKNQGYLFDIAEKLKDYKIHFHFVGNQADNFSDYWKPINKRNLSNCFIHGERDDVDIFYQASDLVIHPSILELNPLAIKEATSYDLPVYLNNLSTYVNMYDSYKNVKYLTMNVDDDSKMILDNFNIKRIDDNSSFEKSLIEEYENVLDKKLDIQVDQEEYLEYNISFTDGAKVEILGNTNLPFHIDFYDKNTNDILYQTELTSNRWCSTNTKYYKEYRIDIKYKDSLIVTHDFNLKGKKVLVQLDSRSIGDTLAWVPYVEEFRKKHDCIISCLTYWNSWFIGQYPEINFVEEADLTNVYARYLIGWYQPIDPNRNPNDYRTQPMQKTASDVLGLTYKELRPKINIPEGTRPIKEKYVCIAQFSTANAKHWHYPCKDSNKGWQIIVDWLNTQGYKVLVISKQKTNLINVIDKTGDFPIEHRINELKYCEFFIGIGSGLSWLAWAIGKKTVMISGFSNPICEYQSNNINVHNFNVCNGCFNKHLFDRGDWNWCPEHKNTDRQFECSINITPQMITDRIVNAKLIENVQSFNFEKYKLGSITLNLDDIKVTYNKDENKLSVIYSADQNTPLINIDFKDSITKKCYHTISDISLSKNYVIWCVPREQVSTETKKLLISFYERNKILDLEFEI